MDWNHGTGIICSRWADSATPVYKSSANDEESPIYKEAIKFKTILFRSNPTVTTAIPANGPRNKHHFSASIPVTSFFSLLLPLKQKTKRCWRSQTWICHSSMRPCGNLSRISNPHSWYPEPGFLWRQGPENSYQTCKKNLAWQREFLGILGIQKKRRYRSKQDGHRNINCKSSIDG